MTIIDIIIIGSNSSSSSSSIICGPGRRCTAVGADADAQDREKKYLLYDIVRCDMSYIYIYMDIYIYIYIYAYTYAPAWKSAQVSERTQWNERGVASLSCR